MWDFNVTYFFINLINCQRTQEYWWTQCPTWWHHVPKNAENVPLSHLNGRLKHDKCPLKWPDVQRQHDEVPSWVLFRGSKHDKVLSMVPLQWAYHDKGPSKVNNVQKCPLGCPSRRKKHDKVTTGSRPVSETWCPKQLDNPCPNPNPKPNPNP